MARPSLRTHPKFKRLVHILQQPVPCVLGHLECLWMVAYERGDPLIGDQTDVELAAEWTGGAGKLCQALLDCRFLDKDGGRYSVHDFHDHVPDHVRRRMERRKNRRIKGKSLGEARSEAGKKGAAGKWGAAMANDGRLPSSPTASGATPAPREEKMTKPSLFPPPPNPSDGFDAFWKAYPRKVAKRAASKAWHKLRPNAALQEAILDALARQKVSEQWADPKYIPYPASWLNGRRWEDQLPATQDHMFAGLKAFVQKGRSDESR